MILQITLEKKVEIFLAVLEIVSWPVTLLFILLFFRKYFTSALARLGTLQAGASGITMTYDKKIANAKKLLKEIQPSSTSKSSVGIKVKSNSSYTKLMDLKMELNAGLIRLATENGIDCEGKTGAILNNELKESGIITLQRAHLIDSLMDVSNSADASFSKDHLKVAE